MKEIIFDFKIDLNVIDSERYILTNAIDLDTLYSVFNGKIFIFFEYFNKKRSYIIINARLLDYVVEFDNVIKKLDKGLIKIDSVSSDYYSNSFKYIYDTNKNSIDIIDSNDYEFIISCDFEIFKNAYLKFRKKIYYELIILYPEVKNNKSFNDFFNLK